MATISGSVINGYRWDIIWSEGNIKVEKNTSDVTATLRVTKVSSNSLSYDNVPHSANITINGTPRTVNVTFDMRSSSVGAYKDVVSNTVTVEHNTDGSKEITISGYQNCDAGSIQSPSVSGKVPLSTIARATTPTLSANTVMMGGRLTINLPRALNSFTHKITYQFGTATGTIAENATTTATWDIDKSLAEQIPNALSGTCTITVTTKNGTSTIGTKTTGVTLQIPDDAYPTMDDPIEIRMDNGVPAEWEMYVQGFSKATITANNAQGVYGSTIRSYKITGGGFSADNSSLTTGVISSSGNITFTVTATDSRNRSVSKSVSIFVVAYSSPYINNTECYRGNVDGTKENNGTYLCVKANAVFSSCNEKNFASMTVSWKPKGASVWGTEVPLNTNELKAIGAGLSVTTAYDVRFSVIDALNTTNYYYATVKTSRRTVHLLKGGLALGIGKYNLKKNTVDSAWVINSDVGFQINGVDILQVLTDKTRPVGSLYWSEDSTDPGILFGGTWKRIKDKFILAAGDTYAAGSKGGEATHTLVEDEIASHRHSTYGLGVDSSSLNGNANYAYAAMRGVNRSNHLNTTEYTDYEGGGKPHNNMPPYETYYCWKRIA